MISRQYSTRARQNLRLNANQLAIFLVKGQRVCGWLRLFNSLDLFPPIYMHSIVASTSFFGGFLVIYEFDEQAGQKWKLLE
jgi:hypothetical protein